MTSPRHAPVTTRPSSQAGQQSPDPEPRDARRGRQAPTHLPHAAHDAELLRVDEALQHHADGHADVILDHVVAQVDARVGLCHADHGLDVPHRDRDAACGLEKDSVRSSRAGDRGKENGDARRQRLVRMPHARGLLPSRLHPLHQLTVCTPDSETFVAS